MNVNARTKKFFFSTKKYLCLQFMIYSSLGTFEKSRRKHPWLSDNPDHSIGELSNGLVQIQFTASKTKLDTWYNKHGIQYASRVAMQAKT